MQLAKRFEALVRKDTRFELCNEVVVSASNQIQIRGGDSQRSWQVFKLY